MTQSIVWARFRGLMIAQSLFNLALYAGLIYTGIRNPFALRSLTDWMVLASLTLGMFFFIEALVIYVGVRYVQKISITDMSNTSWLGVTWSGLAKLRRQVKDLAKTKQEFESQQPALINDSNFQSAMRRGDLVTANSISARLYRFEIRALNEQTRRDVRETAKLKSQFESLMATARALRIPEDLLDEAREKGGLTALNALIAERQRIESLLTRARELGFGEITHAAVQHHGVEYATILCARLQALNERAFASNAPDEALEALQRGEISDAERLIEAAESRRAWVIEKQALLQRAQKLHPSTRVDIMQRLERLDGLPYGSRQFRMELHEVQKVFQ